MKKKLLTVLLAVVMVFGIFSLTACGSEPNPADDYNYYRSVYSSLKDEEDIRIHSMVFMQLTMMLRTPGQYLIYTGGAWDSKAQANIKAVNDIAKAYDVQVYNLDLKLDGGISETFTGADLTKYGSEEFKGGSTVNYKDGIYVNSADNRLADAVPNTAEEGEQSNAKPADPSKSTISNKVAAIRVALQQYLGTYKSHGLTPPEGLQDNDIPEAALISLDVTAAPATTTSDLYEVWDAKANEGKGAYVAVQLTEKQLATAEPATNPLAAFKVDFTGIENAPENITGKVDVFVTEDGASSTSYKVTVKEGAIDSDSKDLEKVIQSIALTVPSFGSQIQSGGDHGTGPYDASGFDASVIDSFDYFGDYRLHMAGDYDTATDDFLEGSGSVYEVITLHEFIDILRNVKEGDFNVFFGGAWCPNTQSIAKITSEMAQDYGIHRIFFFDPNLDGSASVYLDGQSVSTGMNIRTSNQATAAGASATDASNMTFSGLYGYLLDTIKAGGQEYTSYWNTQWKSDMLGKGNRYKLFINDQTYTRMCVPNIMGFTGTSAGAKLEIWKEAEYVWADTSVADSPVRIAWDNAVKEVFEANDYAVYNPIMRVEEVEEEEAATDSGAAAAPSAPAADAGGC